MIEFAVPTGNFAEILHGRMAQLVVPTGYFVEISYGRMAQLVEHIVHIDGVTGSSPVATTNPKKS